MALSGCSGKLGAGDPDSAIGAVLNYVSVRDLFACAKVNKAWERVAHTQLRKRLSWIVCSYPGNARNEISSLNALCTEMKNFCTIAREAQKMPVLCFLVMSAFREDERTVIREVRRSLPTDSVVVLFKSLLQNATSEQTRYGLNACLIFDTLAEPTNMRPFYHWTSKIYNLGQVSARRGHLTTTEALNHVRELKEVGKFLTRLLTPEHAVLPDDSFMNTAPGVFTFMSKIHVPYKNGGLTRSYYMEDMTGHKLQVTTTALPATMKDSSAEALWNLRDALEDGKGTMIVVFQRHPVDAILMESIRSTFSKFPILIARDAVEELPSTVGGAASVPPYRARATLMAIKLVPRDAAIQKAPRKAPKVNRP